MISIFKEKLYEGLYQEIKIKKLLISKKSKFQKIKIFDTKTYGRVLTLDGVIQITEKDEAAYSEMLVHPAIQCLTKKVSNVLIIGGGDGAVAEEILKYNFIKKIDLVDIDKEVVSLSKKYFKKINNNSLSNKKLNIFYEDALKFIANTKNTYDIIIADRPDPIGAAKSLYKSDFYKNVNKIMSKNSLAIFQSGVPFLQNNELKAVTKDLDKYFKYSGFFLTVVPSYIGGFMALAWSSNNTNLTKKRKYYNYIKTEYYNKDILEGAFAIPNFIKISK
jgi:spermidine synthase